MCPSGHIGKNKKEEKITTYINHRKTWESIGGGIHHFQTKEFEDIRLHALSLSVEERKKTNTFHMIENNPNVKRLSEGTYNFIGKNQNEKMLLAGTRASKIKKTYPHCGIIMDSANYGRYHGNKCKYRK